MRSFTSLTRAAMFIAMLTFAASAFARTVIVELNDGRKIEGELVSNTPTALTIRIGGVEMNFSHAEIKKIENKLSLDEQYELKRAALRDDDYNGRYELSRWLFDQKSEEATRLSIKELDRILSEKPDHVQAKVLRGLAQTQLEQLTKPAGTVNPPILEKPPVKPEEIAGGAPRSLKGEEVNLIKVLETNLNARPSISVPNDVVTKVLEQFKNERVMAPYLGREGEAKFRQMAGWQQLDVIFQLKARDLYDKVIVREVPEPLNKFRQNFHPNYIVRHCGRCHAEGQAPGYYVLTVGHQKEEVAYANLILTARTYSGPLPLIFKDEPRRSPLIQFGLPLKDAATPHPTVAGWTSYFRGPDDPKYTQFVEWIDSLYMSPENYPIKLDPPTWPGREKPPAPAENPDQAPPAGAGDAPKDEGANPGK